MDLCIFCLVFLFTSLKAENGGKKVYNCQLPESSNYIRGLHVKYGAKIEEEKIRILQHKCGKLCSNESPLRRGNEFDFVTTEFDCTELFLLSQEFEETAEVPKSPPHWEQFSSYLTKALSTARGFQSKRCYMTEKKDDVSEDRFYGKEFLSQYLKNVEQFLENVKNTIESNIAIKPSYYEAHILLQKAAAHVNITDKSVLIIGTSHPWIEALLFKQNPGHVTTVDYNLFESDIPNWSVMTPSTYRQRYLNGTLDTFDFVFTFSSVEHSGLGRYGDSINPWADIIAIAESHCASSAEAKLVIGVPTVHQPRGGLFFNAHRIYGDNNYPYLVQNWKFSWKPEYNNLGNTNIFFENYQPIYVFEKAEQP